MTHRRNVEGLRNNAQKKSLIARQRADEAIKLLLKEQRAINFKAVAQQSGLSMAYLYNNQVLKARIEQLRFQPQPRVAIRSRTTASDPSKDAIIATLREQIKLLQKENEKLTRQNEVAYGLIYQQNNSNSTDN